VPKFSDLEYLEGIRKRDNLVLKQLYKEFFPSVRTFVFQNSGSEDDASDLFQESVIVVYRQVHEGREINCSLSTYLFSVSRLLWLKELRRRKKFDGSMDSEAMQDQLEDYSPGVLDQMESHDRMAIYQQAFMKLGEDCRKILKLFYEKVSLREIANIMGFASEKYAKKRKFKCKEKLVSLIEKDDRFGEVKQFEDEELSSD
jgi:RNA polymerase sigma factor (sigma-70 family)